MSDRTATLQLGDFDRHGTTRARFGGRWIEIEHGIPGETVRAEIVGGKRPRGHIFEIVEPAPDRILPPCPYFRDWACGGCQWQHISYEGQLDRKRQAIEAAMRHAGHDLRVSAVHALEHPWRYRSTAGIALGKRAGFRRHGSLAIVPLHDCPISHPSIGRLAAALNEVIGTGYLPDYRGRVRVDVRVVQGDQLQACIRSSDARAPLDADIQPLVAALQRHPEVRSVLVEQGDGSIEVESGELFAPVEVAGRPVWLTAVSFFQTNLLLLPKLIGRLQDEAASLDGQRIADVYGGVGLFGLFLARDAREVIEIESDPVAVEAGRLTAERWGLSSISFTPAMAEDALSNAGQFDVVIVDPPRSGLTPPVIEALTSSRPQLLLYVSCLAESLARDLGPLTAAGYSVKHLELFDFYPQTYHNELLAVLHLPEFSH